MAVWITVPTYNEAENIHALLSSVFQFLPEAHVVVVDDNSPDGTADIVADWQRTNPQVHLLRRQGKLGYASAIVTGLQYALSHGAEWLGHMDADFSHDPQRLPDLWQAVKEGADLAIGSRYVPGGGVQGWSLFRQVLSRSANRLVRTTLGLHVRDCTSGFRMYRRRALEKLSLQRLQVEGYGFLYLSTALAVWNGLRIVEVPILFVDRRHGKSKLSRRIIAEAAIALGKVFVWRHTGLWLGKPLIQ